MNLIFRLLHVYVCSLFRERLPIGSCNSNLPMVVLPNDFDNILPMNNGRYLTICDRHRVNLFIRRAVIKHADVLAALALDKAK